HRRGRRDACQPCPPRAPGRSCRRWTGATEAARDPCAAHAGGRSQVVTSTAAVNTDALWLRYHRDGDAEARSELLSQLMGLVHHVARQIANRVGDAVAYEDLVGAGSLGLVQALSGFDPERGVKIGRAHV